MHTEAEPIPVEAGLASARRRLAEENHNSWPVGERSYLRGVISGPELEMAQPNANTVGDVIKLSSKYAFVHADHPLSYALERMGTARVDVLPVVSRANIRQMQGIVSLTDVLAAYGLARQTLAHDSLARDQALEP